MTSVIDKLPDSFTDTSLPRLFLDPAMTVGSRYVFDWTNPACNAADDGALANGTTFTNLVDGGVGGSISGQPGSPVFSNAAGKAGIVCAGANDGVSRLNIGTTGTFDNDDDEFFFTLWAKLPASDYTASLRYLMVRGQGGNRTNSQFVLDFNNSGIAPYFSVNDPDGTPDGQVSAGNTTPGSVFQVGVHWDPANGTLKSFLNGVLVNTDTSVPDTLLDSTAYVQTFRDSMKITLFRVREDNMATLKAYDPSVDAAALIAAEYATFSGAFS